MPLDPALLDRFHQTLVDEIRRSRPEYLQSAFTVGEIYRELVPYRTHRDAIGVGINGDYEDALLRLLGGEGEYLILESERAKSEIRKELESNNPNTSLFRDFASVDVRLNPASIEASATDTDVAEVTSHVNGAAAESRTGVTADDEDPAAPVVDSGPAVESREEEPREVVAQEIEPQEPQPLAAMALDDGSSDHPDVSGETSELALTETEADPEAGPLVAVDPTEMAEPPEERGPAPDPTAQVDDSASSPGDDADGNTADDRRVWAIESRPDSTDHEGSGGTDPIGAEGPDATHSDEPAGVNEETTKSATGTCWWCDGDLPDRDSLNYCPRCGEDLRLRPCTECGEPLETAWRFCIACGSEVTSA